MEPLEITAGSLHLRPWQAGDEPLLVATCSDPEVVRWTSVPSPYTAEHARAYVQEAVPQGWASGSALSWAVCDSTTSQVLADVALRPGRDAGVWDVSCWAVPAARGRGVVPDAVAAVCRWAFAELSAARVEWLSAPDDWASRRAAEKAGFRAEGVLRGGMRHRGANVDGWIAARLPGDPDADTARFPPYADRTDGVVTLRRWRVADAPEVARACDDEETARWLPVPVPYTREVALGYVDGIVPQQWAEGVAANVAVTDATTGELLGAAGLTLREGIGEVGYWTAPWARGRGVAVRAARLHAGWGVEVLGLPRVELLTDVRNVASQRVAERAGFAREGVARAVRAAPRSTERVDMVVWAHVP